MRHGSAIRSLIVFNYAGVAVTIGSPITALFRGAFF
jgi:hypothetical protein